MLAVYTYSNDIYSLAWGVVLSRVIGLSRTSKTDNPNSLTLSFLYKPFLLGLGKSNLWYYEKNFVVFNECSNEFLYVSSKVNLCKVV